MYKFKRGDQVLITSGKDKGRKGEIVKILPRVDKVIVQGINLRKKHTKPVNDKKGGIFEIETPLSTAKITLLTETGKTTRAGFKTTQAGKYRISRLTGKKL